MDPLRLANPCALPLQDLPLQPADRFRERAEALLSAGHRPAALLALPLPDAPLALVALLADDRAGSFAALASPATPGETRPSFAVDHPALHIDERVVAEATGIVFSGHPWPKPAVYAHDRADRARRRADHPFFRMAGEEAHEVAVGPVHAGVIEPGHFRFQCHGERVFHLETLLGYQHRGAEKLLLHPHPGRRLEVAQSLAGDTLLGHGIAHCLLEEALSGVEAPPRAALLRAAALEMERAAMHLADLAALANDVAYLPGASHFGATRTLVINSLLALCGSRFGRGLLAVGGACVDPSAGTAGKIAATLDQVGADLETLAADLFSSVTVLSRFERTGIVPPDAARALGLTGFAGRASGVDRDVRLDHPADGYRLRRPEHFSLDDGSVYARARIRHLECGAALRYAARALRELPAGPVRAGARPLRVRRLGIALVEGWRGEILHAAVTGGDGTPLARRAVDPSRRNWTGLELALRGEPISDFPLCNKSFNQSYCGFDL